MAIQVFILPPYDKSSLEIEMTIADDITLSADISIESLTNNFKLFNAQPAVVVGCEKTNISYWTAAQIAFPTAKFYVSEKGDLEEFKINFADDKECELVDDTADENEADDLEASAFKYASWNDTAENRRIILDIEDEAKLSIQSNPDLIEAVRYAINRGKKSNELKKELISKVSEGESNDNIRRWIDVVSDNYEKLFHDLIIEHKKINKKIKNQKLRRANKYKCNMDRVVVNGLHENSIRSLEPSQKWTVLIDETGNHFNPEDMDGLHKSDTKIGKVIALVIPQEITLPPLEKKFHAVNETDNDIESIVKTLLENKVGVLGYSMNDTYYTSHSWMAAIAQLTKWVMFLLPIEEESNVDVEFLIEQKGIFKPDTSLQALQQDIESTLKNIAPNRYRNLRLKLTFIGKDGHPANGYVDTIANIWGSPSKNRKKILSLSSLKGHCLMNSSERNLEQTLLALQSSEPLSAQLWFELCEFAGIENEYSLANQFLDDIGNDVANNNSIWESYVVSLKQRLQDKKFTTAGLGAALNWLNKYSPDETTLDNSLLLLLKSTQLALKNHQGDVDLQLISECISLSSKLKDEMAVECCNVILRIASSTTNAFDFESMIEPLKVWIDEPIATPGLLNHGKLHSSLGQLHAFKQQYPAALASFQHATNTFERLSDASSRERNIQQTQMYTITVLMDQGNLQAIELLNELLDQQFSHVSDHKIRIYRLARSGEEYRFLNHLFLRACIIFPNEMKQDSDYYLAKLEEWGVGESHPWMLIQAYRGWLLLRKRSIGKGKLHFQQSIWECLNESHGPTVKWMGVVLHKLAMSFELNLGIDDKNLDEALSLAPGLAPKETLDDLAMIKDDNERLVILEKLLPFNFH
jgi:hypothetical protein